MSDSVAIRSNLHQLNDAIALYKQLRGKSWHEVLAKQGGKLGFALRRRLRDLAPNRGEVRAEALERLREGLGIRVRPSVWEEVMVKKNVRTRLTDRSLVFGRGEGTRMSKRGNLYAIAVAREIAIRESARGFLGWSARYPRELKSSQKAWSRYRQVLSEANIVLKPDEKNVVFEWAGTSPQSRGAVEGLKRPRARAAIIRALQDTRRDIQIFIDRKQQDLLRQSFSLVNPMRLTRIKRA